MRLIDTDTPGSSFDGWTEDCSGFSFCDLPMTGPRTASASFGVRAPQQ